MDSLEKEQLFDAIYMAIFHCNKNTARHIFYEALQLTEEETLKKCIELYIKNDALNSKGDHK